MVRIVDGRGRVFNVSVLGSMLPSPSRPAVRALSSRFGRKKPRGSGTSGVDHKEKEKNEGSTASGVAAESDNPSASSASYVVSRLGQWNSEDDDQLLKLRDTDKKRWVEIVVIMGRSKDLLVERYNELKHGKFMSDWGLDSERDIQQGLSSFEDTEWDDDDWSATDPTDYFSETAQNPYGLEPQEQSLSLREVRLAIRLVDYLENQKWLILASKLFDKTGKRFAPKDLKEILAEDVTA